MRYFHGATGLEFVRVAGRRPVHVIGNTYEHRQALVRAGFRWDGDRKQYTGDVECVVRLAVPEAFRIGPEIGIRRKSKIRR